MHKVIVIDQSPRIRDYLMINDDQVVPLVLVSMRSEVVVNHQEIIGKEIAAKLAAEVTNGRLSL